METENIVIFEQVGIKRKDFELENINFVIPHGYLIGLVGNNGAGKTTLLNLMAQQLTNFDGNIYIDGMDARKSRVKILDRIALVNEKRDFFMDQNCQQNRDIYAQYYHVWKDDTYENLLTRFEIHPEMKLSNMSRGMYIRFQVAFALAHEPKLLLLDEPTGGLDPVFRRDFLRLLRELIVDEDMTIVMSTHLDDELDRIADYMITMDGHSCNMEMVVK
jgi:ABC-2 type transport system ATP-binding protein